MIPYFMSVKLFINNYVQIFVIYIIWAAGPEKELIKSDTGV